VPADVNDTRTRIHEWRQIEPQSSNLDKIRICCFTAVVPKLVRAVTQIKVAITIYYPVYSARISGRKFVQWSLITQRNLVVFVPRHPPKNRGLPPGVIYPHFRNYSFTVNVHLVISVLAVFVSVIRYHSTFF